MPLATLASLALSIVVLTPILWIFALSLKTSRETLRPGLLPLNPQPGNYLEAFTRYGLGQLFLNSALVTIGSVVITVVSPQVRQLLQHR